MLDRKRLSASGASPDTCSSDDQPASTTQQQVSVEVRVLLAWYDKVEKGIRLADPSIRALSLTHSMKF